MSVGCRLESKVETHLDVELSKSHVPAICKAYKKTTSVQSADARCSHHDHVRDTAEDASHPEALSSTEPCGEDTSTRGTNERSQRHERRYQLLSPWRDVPSDGISRIVGIWITKDLHYCGSVKAMMEPEGTHRSLAWLANRQ
jgi:hypothetical protein